MWGSSQRNKRKQPYIIVIIGNDRNRELADEFSGDKRERYIPLNVRVSSGGHH
jgi:hypothetical protein